MKESNKIAKNYAQSLFELGKDDLALQETFLNDIKIINEAINKMTDAKKVFENPGISKDEKKKLVETLRQSISTTVINFLYLLIDKQRFNLLPEIQDWLIKFVNNKKGIVVAEISSACELDSSALEKLKVKLENILSKSETVKIETRVEPELIGGMKVKINDLVYDGSIKGRLENLKRRLG